MDKSLLRMFANLLGHKPTRKQMTAALAVPHNVNSIQRDR